MTLTSHSPIGLEHVRMHAELAIFVTLQNDVGRGIVGLCSNFGLIGHVVKRIGEYEYDRGIVNEREDRNMRLLPADEIEGNGLPASLCIRGIGVAKESMPFGSS